jgi:hypothetical protein
MRDFAVLERGESREGDRGDDEGDGGGVDGPANPMLAMTSKAMKSRSPSIRASARCRNS